MRSRLLLVTCSEKKTAFFGDSFAVVETAVGKQSQASADGKENERGGAGGGHGSIRFD